MIVMKFGGSSVATREQIEKVLGIVATRAAELPVVVVSAHRGITDALIAAARAAAKGHAHGEEVIDRQTAIASSLGCAPVLLEPLFGEIRDLLRGIRLVRELSPRSLDYISSFGERMSARCIADFFSRRRVNARAFDAWDLGFVTDANFGRARPVVGFETGMKRAFAELEPGMVPIVTGFIGRTDEGDITTVGRNGSDLTATVIGAAMGAREVQIWSDTDGVMTADPSVVPAARSIPHMRFDEAAELAYFGSRVLHPATLVPAMEREIPVRVMNTNRPEHPGTVIESRPQANPRLVTSIAYKEGQAVLTLTSPRMFEQVGFLAEVFRIVAEHRIDVDTIATSEISVSISTFDVANLESAVADLEALGHVAVVRKKTILSIVGQHMAHTQGLGARILGCIADSGVNVDLMSFGMNSLNLTLIIDDADINTVVPTLHRALFEA